MLYGLYKTSSSSVRDFMSIGNNPLGYVCRINRAIPLRLPEEKGDIIFQLLPILKAILQTKLTMEKMNDIIRKTSSTLRLDLITNEMLSPSFHYETNQKKRKRNNTNV
ncbi:hypothetical protein BDF21DRAFT_414351 [Thamnidium elegans]|nr:hypothetical protein BDF21DRAFT_414351 [Thamnidium elegans]